MPPKTASNSLNECILDSSLKIESYPNNYNYPKIHLFLSEIVNVFDINEIKEYKIVQLTRNPYYRFVSAFFHNKKILPKNHPFQSLNIIEFAKRNLQKLSIKKPYESIDFTNKKSWGGRRTILQQNQWCDIDDVNIKYFKIEDLQNGMDKVSDFIGIYLPDMSVQNENNIKVNYDDYLTDELKHLIKLLNYHDFKILGYEG
jgi:hypothetical protein